MGSNLNAEDAVQAEISYATVSVLSLDYLVTVLGMGPVFPTYMAPFWSCTIELTTMSKDVTVGSLDPADFYRCGFQKASISPAYIETELQVLCRLVFRVDEILLRDLDRNVHSNLSACSDLAPLASLEQQNDFRQIEWFLIDTTTLAKRTRIRDNTSRQIRTFLLLLSLIGSIYYVVEYLTILKSFMIFIRNSLSASQAQSASPRAQTIRVQEFLQFDPAVGALSNTFSLASHAEIASEDGTIAIFCRPSIAITIVWLLFAVLSSGFWIALVTQQMQKIGRRLRSHADPNWVHKWMLSHCAVLLIYVVCEAATDLVLENVMLRSDPHLYAICGGLFISFLISIAFRIIHYSHRRSSPDTAINGSAAAPSNRRRLIRFPSFSAHDTTAQEQNILSRWSSSRLDGVLQQCAAPTIALQLIWYCSMKRSYEDAELPQSAVKYQSALVASSSFRISEFVTLHTAAGVWTHLETLEWSYDDTRTKLSLRRIALTPLEKNDKQAQSTLVKPKAATVFAT